jgi:hypothetical protein
MFHIDSARQVPPPGHAESLRISDGFRLSASSDLVYRKLPDEVAP